jgi:prepilin-type N-terminal cleavage/methylation domain-containing protein/prepilin-type processing-associated H-X9-DG protein
VRRGFTLVELLVVIGIIAVLVGILLPTLNRVRQQANMVKCAAQMRDIINGLLSYSAENGGSMPYSHVWRLSGKTPQGYPTGGPQLTGAEYRGFRSGSGRYYGEYWAPGIWWAKVVSDRSFRNGEGGVWPTVAALDYTGTIPPAAKLLQSFRCPDILNNEYYSGATNAYSFNPVILVNQSFEINPNGTTSNYRGGLGNPTLPWVPDGFTTPNGGMGGTIYPIAPAKISQLYSDNAVIWDSQVVNSPAGAFVPSNTFGGFGMSGIDSGQMAMPQKSWFRYRRTGAPLSEPWELDNYPIIIYTKKMEAKPKNAGSAAAGAQWTNNDPYNGFLAWPDQVGNARFRHMNNRYCNVAFADGSVRSLGGQFDKVSYLDALGMEVAKTEFLRGYLRIKQMGRLPPPQMDYTP